MISNIFANLNLQTDINEKLIRHMVLKSIRSYKNRFGQEFGQIVICCDSHKYWRRGDFSYYKSNRKNDRDQSGLDWDFVFRTINQIKKELIETFPYKVIEVVGAEADDVIAILTQNFQGQDKILILSGDKDFKQLHVTETIATKYNLVVKQYAPIQKEFITCDNPFLFLREQIIRGDRGDGIPNILSPEDCIYNGVRQVPITRKFLESFNLDNLDSKTYKRFAQNERVIDFQCIPIEISDAIITAYNEPLPEKTKMMDYFIKHQLSELMPNIGDFV